MSTAFQPYDLGGKRLANRIVMAPMTRSRAYGDAQCATDLM
jgi:N-ethylmaleimide reductase